MGYVSDKDDDRIWNEAMDWLLRIKARPGDPPTRAAFDVWLAASDAHAAAFAEASNVWRLTGQVPLLDASGALPDAETEGQSESDRVQSESSASRESDFSFRVLGRTRPRLQARYGGVRRTKRLAATCGISVLAACLTFLFFPALLLRLTADYITKVGETRIVTLDDGTRVHLNTDSALRISYTPEQRQVELLAGEAFFNVTPDPERAFLVHADRGTIRVLGTAFQVRLDQLTLSIAVQSGTVSVSGDLPAAAETRALQKGQALQLTLTTGATKLYQTAPDQVATWRDGRLIVDHWTVGAAVNEIARYYRGLILLTDTALARQPISGVYDLRDPVAAVKAVVHPYAATVWEITPYVVIVSAR